MLGWGDALHHCCTGVDHMNRAQIIHDTERLKVKRSKYSGRGKTVLQTPAVCSCPMCGNQRKHFGERTVQERRAMQEVE